MTPPTREWVCPKCKGRVTTALPSTEVSHLCPAAVQRPIYLKPFEGTTK